MVERGNRVVGLLLSGVAVLLLAGASATTQAAPAEDAEAPVGYSRGVGERILFSSVAEERIRPPSKAHGTTVARITAPARVRARLKDPRKYRVVVPQTSWGRNPHVLMVLRSARYQGKVWLRLRLASRPNGSAGWIRRDRVILGRTGYWITVRLKQRSVRVFRNGKLTRTLRAVIGAPGTPTPRGLGAIYEKNLQAKPGGFIGPWAVPLTFSSNVLKNYGGGPGRIAIHGRAGASLADPLGTARSHGCVRVHNRQIRWLVRKVPVATPVRIVSGG